MSNPGQYRHRIAHYSPVNGKSPSGAPLVQLARQRYAWAKVTGSGTSSSEAGEREQAVNRFKVELMQRPGIAYAFGDWILRNQRWLKVIGVDDTDPEQARLYLECEHNPSEPPPPVIEAQP